MVITRDVVNNYFNALISLPREDALSEEGFTALADWSEQQEWWRHFAMSYCLEADWRTTYMGDPINFAVTLFRFLNASGVSGNGR